MGLCLGLWDSGAQVSEAAERLGPASIGVVQLMPRESLRQAGASGANVSAERETLLQKGESALKVLRQLIIEGVTYADLVSLNHLGFR